MSVPRRVAFTLIELLTVIAIIGILAAIIIPTATGVRNAAKRAATKVRFSQWALAMEQFKQEYGYYPAVTTSGLLAPSRFLAALTGRDHLGHALSPQEANGNTRLIGFYGVAEAELVKDVSGSALVEMVDAFGNSDIVILTDADGSGVISGPELVPLPVRPGNSIEGFGGSLAPDPENFPEAGIRAGIVLYSAGAGTSADDIVYSWK